MTVSTTEVELFSAGGHDGMLHQVNEAFATLLGRSPEEVNGRSLLELVHPEDLTDIVVGLAALENGAPEVLLENRFMQRDGRCVHLQWVARPLTDTASWWAAGRDTTDFHRLLAEQVDLRARLDLALGQSTVAMWDLDVRADRLSWEAQAAEVLGVSPADVPGSFAALADVVVAEDGSAVANGLIELAANGVIQIGVRVGSGPAQRYLSLRGKVLDKDRRGRPQRAVGLVVDITAEKAMEEQMLRMVMSDGLTGIPNRRAFDQALRSEWRRCSRALQPLTVVMIDIDDFKHFNDTNGHLVGDEALCAVARALKSVVHREGDTLARFGGEEFAIVLPNTDTAGASTLADRLVESVRSVTVRQAAGWKLTVSVGTATSDADSQPMKATELLRHADDTLYAAKKAGKDRALNYAAPA